MQYSKELSLFLFKIFSNKSRYDNIKCLIFKKNLINFTKKDDMCEIACEMGDLSLLMYSHKNGYPLDKNIPFLAVCDGHLDCIKYMHENGCELDDEIMKYAAQYGHLDVLKYAHENGCEFHYETTALAAEGGHLSVLMYAHENGCELDEDTILNAAQYGHLECLKYAHQNGCEFYLEGIYNIVSDAYANYVHEAFAGFRKEKPEKFWKLALIKQFDCLKYVHEHMLITKI